MTVTRFNANQAVGFTRMRSWVVSPGVYIPIMPRILRIRYLNQGDNGTSRFDAHRIVESSMSPRFEV